MVEKTLIKHMINWLETLSTEELQLHKKFVITEINRVHSTHLRKEMQFALRLVEEEQMARNIIQSQAKEDVGQ